MALWLFMVPTVLFFPDVPTWQMNLFIQEVKIGLGENGAFE